MATSSRILAWEIPGTEEPGRLQFIGSQKAGHGLAPRAPMRGGSQGLGVGGGPGECGLHTGQVGTAAPPAALEGPAAVGRTRNG